MVFGKLTHEAQVITPIYLGINKAGVIHMEILENQDRHDGWSCIFLPSIPCEFIHILPNEMFASLPSCPF